MPRDLKADKGFLDFHIAKGRLDHITVNSFVEQAIHGWPDAIERAIAAETELEMSENECEMCKNDKVTMAIDRIAELSAQVAAVLIYRRK